MNDGEIPKIHFPRALRVSSVEAASRWWNNDGVFARTAPMPPLRGLGIYWTGRFYKEAAPTELAPTIGRRVLEETDRIPGRDVHGE